METVLSSTLSILNTISNSEKVHFDCSNLQFAQFQSLQSKTFFRFDSLNFFILIGKISANRDIRAGFFVCILTATLCIFLVDIVLS